MTIIYSNSVTICFSCLTYFVMFMFLMSVFLFTFLTYVQQRRLAACSITIEVGFTWFYADSGTFVCLIWALSVNRIYEIFTVKATVSTDRKPQTNSGKYLYHGIPLSEWAFDRVKWWVLCGLNLWPRNYLSSYEHMFENQLQVQQKMSFVSPTH